MFTCVRGGTLKQSEGGTPVSELCSEHGMSSASDYKWRAMFGGMDSSLIAEMKDVAEQNRRLKKIYAEMSMQNDWLKEALEQKPLRPSHRRELAKNAVAEHGVIIALAFRTFQISETCYR